MDRKYTNEEKYLGRPFNSEKEFEGETEEEKIRRLITLAAEESLIEQQEIFQREEKEEMLREEIEEEKLPENRPSIFKNTLFIFLILGAALFSSKKTFNGKVFYNPLFLSIPFVFITSIVGDEYKIFEEEIIKISVFNKSLHQRTFFENISKEGTWGDINITMPIGTEEEVLQKEDNPLVIVKDCHGNFFYEYVDIEESENFTFISNFSYQGDKNITLKRIFDNPVIFDPQSASVLVKGIKVSSDLENKIVNIETKVFDLPSEHISLSKCML